MRVRAFRNSSGADHDDLIVAVFRRPVVLVCAMLALATGAVLMIDIDLGSRAHAWATGGVHRPRRRAGPRAGRMVSLGRSLEGRLVAASEIGDPRVPSGLLVIGCVHGDECAGAAVTRLLARHPPPSSHIWTIDDLNPDGYAAGRRGNARGVDLNRNFPWHWRPFPRGAQYSGPRPLSEPESALAYRLILRVRPRVTIWLHQPLGVVDESGGNVAVERRFARLAGLPLRRLTRYPGSAASWQDHRLPGTTAFVVELGPGPLSSRGAERLARAAAELVAPGRQRRSG